jgi:hypothetical protein
VSSFKTLKRKSEANLRIFTEQETEVRHRAIPRGEKKWYRPPDTGITRCTLCDE